MTRKSIGVSYLIGVTSQSRTFCEIHFPCMVFTRALSEEQRAYIALFVNEKDVSVKQISQKTGISPTTIRSTNNT